MNIETSRWNLELTKTIPGRASTVKNQDNSQKMSGRHRWSEQDSDEARLPAGMRRVGYDADTQIYSYEDSDGSYWKGEPGSRYGTLHPCGNSTSRMMRSESATSKPPTIESGDENIDMRLEGTESTTPSRNFNMIKSEASKVALKAVSVAKKLATTVQHQDLGKKPSSSMSGWEQGPPTRLRRAATMGDRVLSVDPKIHSKAMRSGSLRDKPAPTSNRDSGQEGGTNELR
ncbi:uncharacterized protein L3040_004369 [Drepanopeziza brunnea f. sp. 'multigermtubi']|uniref:uncharacterized protein n=1 Tax=Drepanopeziza brunnea f. sp. 'multigermtubi' TaxID=698441 RepID=UPI00238EE8F7|nr:hypothetical protein L3040_004369 [Drepanopeziza brunnea f. sp. 'multigermtubi']